MIRVLAVENDEDFTYLIRTAINGQSDMELISCTATREDAIHMAVQHQPDIVLMDLNLSNSNLDGIEAAKEIRLSTNAKIIILTAFENPHTVIEASKKAFASGYIFKSQFEFLVDTIRKTAQGHTPQEQMIQSLILNDLTAAELGVLKSIFEPDRRLLSSQKTIANQKTTILKKLGLKNRRDLEKIFCNFHDII